MTTATRGVLVLIALALWGLPAVTRAQSSQPPLAEVARQEAERRRTIGKAGKVYTNADVKGGRPLTTAGAAPAPSRSAEADREGDRPAEGDERAERGEAREAVGARIAALQQELARKRAELERLVGWINTLNTRIAESFDAVERETLERDRDATMAERDRLEEEIRAQDATLIELAAQAKAAAGGAPAPTRPQP